MSTEHEHEHEPAALRATLKLASGPRAAQTAVPAVPAVDVYGGIHRGLRFGLCELLTRAAQTSPHDQSCTQRILDDLHGLLYMLASHGELEEAHLHAAMEARRAGGSAPFAAVHEALERCVVELRARCCAFSSAASADERAGTWRAFYLCLSTFTGLQLAHMSDEELRAQPLLDALYSVDELRAVYGALLRSIGPDERVAAMRLMLLGCNAVERELLLAGARAVLPAEAVASLIAWARVNTPACAE